MSVVGYDNAGTADFPMPALWKDCPKTLLNDQGRGIFLHENFLAFPVGNQSTNAVVTDIITFKSDVADTSLAHIDDERYGGIEMETDATAGDCGALVTRPFGRMVKNSGQKLWFEARVAPGDVDADMGSFIGIVELDGADGNIIGDDPADITDLADQSMVGFAQLNDDPDAYQAVYKVAGSSAVQVLADVTNATAIPSGDRASLTDDTFVRLGVRFDGVETVEFWCNGYRVATTSVDNVDQTQDMCGISQVITGAAAAEKTRSAYMRAAFDALGQAAS